MRKELDEINKKVDELRLENSELKERKKAIDMEGGELYRTVNQDSINSRNKTLSETSSSKKSKSKR